VTAANREISEAILLLGEKDQGTGDVYNMATGKSSSIAEVAKVVCKVCKAKPKFLFSGQNRPGDAEKWEVDNRKLKKLGFNPKTSLEEGIVKVKKWIEEKGIVKGTYD
jgi:nucleoside-diphosphate-sugar epimerase